MFNLQNSLKNKLQNASQVVLLGVGSDLRGDDVVGLLVSKLLQTYDSPRLKVIEGGTAPENFTGEIKKQSPSHLIIVDAADMGLVPGSIKLIGTDKLGGFSFSTHSLPLNVMVDYLLADIKCEVIVIGVQPSNLKFGLPVTPAVTTAANEIAEAVKAAI